MNNAYPETPPPENEPVRAYAPGSEDRRSVQERLRELRNQTVEIPAFVGGTPVYPGSTSEVVPPHDHQHTLGEVHQSGKATVDDAIDAAMEAKAEWAAMDFSDRAAIFLRAADLIAGPYRDTLNAATMLGQGKSIHQAEIDAACELVDFLRFNVHYAEQIYRDQPNDSQGIWNQMQYRPLEGFVLAVTPFNFTAIQGNLPTAPALMGNTVLWKPASRSVYSAFFFYKILEEAGLPPGVINMLPADDGAAVGTPALQSEHFAGLHFTGSVGTFDHLWSTIGDNLDTYRTYPTIVGETGGKDFIVAHPSAHVEQLATAVVRGSFEYQGQKCSAASRLYMPESIWPDVRREITSQLDEVTVGPPEDFTNFLNAVIDQRAFDKIVGYIERAREADDAEIVYGGDYDDSTGYFIEPTIIRAHAPKETTMCEEIFGPVTTVYVYPDEEFASTLPLVDETSPYGLTGSIFARDRAAIKLASDVLEQAAGNFYINDKPTGAVVGEQPFGGARRSGTNDKAGSAYNLMRWVSPRAIKENLNPPTHHGYAWNQPDATKATDAPQEAGDGAVAS
ncbi:1-pyrroline-5-carboxylate dehydrogenase [Salinibacter ruber]|uniref:L-glutamate gamma-semialdehyde dehydrogenase n=1 Tax=Salinibacter ruber TaxID=146919 RepID=A0A9X2PXY8_9BACT|nr:L-glutamate gamma-semialdehyde dehydrogenase [Salinibacter ruber]MCS3676824.1 1-pyrroline-5-carboxylate dehydrogenase [Salinibacter ruber]MCS3680112.1 1-pyrroline-5-carboxylate dehydrogenase [Salinibacter ruber]